MFQSTGGRSYKEGMNVPVSDRFPSLNEIYEGAGSLHRRIIRSDEIAVPIRNHLYTSGTTGDPKGRGCERISP